MGIATRIFRLLSSDAHALLDVLEDKRALLQQSLREMEEALADERAQLARLIDVESLHLKQLLKDQERREAIDKEVVLCVESGEDRLARSAVKRRLETERRESRRRAVLDELVLRKERLQQEITLHEKQLEEIRVEAKSADFSEDKGTSWGNDVPFDLVTDDEVEAALLAARSKLGSLQSARTEKVVTTPSGEQAPVQGADSESGKAAEVL